MSLRTLLGGFLNFFKKKTDFTNPLKLSTGQYINLTTLDESGLQFKVMEISELTRTIQGHSHKTTDYCVFAKSLNLPEVSMRIRMNPTSESPSAGLGQNILKLQLFDEIEFSQDFYEMLLEKHQDTDSPDFIEYNDDDSVKATWFRIGGVETPYHAVKRSLHAKDNLRQSILGEIETDAVDYWDYEREINGQTEYLFIEMANSTHMFQIWKGVEIDESEIFS